MIRDGWVFTGDLGYVDEDGYVFIVDRKKDLIKPASGFQVWPREVEEVIATHPAVAEVSVAGVPRRDRQRAGEGLDRPARRPAATAEEIIAFCRCKLAGYKVPRQVEFRENLPKSMVGKVLRRILVEDDRPSDGDSGRRSGPEQAVRAGQRARPGLPDPRPETPGMTKEILMPRMTAVCGLDCAACDGYKATQANDQALKEHGRPLAHRIRQPQCGRRLRHLRRLPVHGPTGRPLPGVPGPPMRVDSRCTNCAHCADYVAAPPSATSSPTCPT